jgi:hypothetical protein
VSPRVDRYGERLDDDDAQPSLPFTGDLPADRCGGAAAPPPLCCELCRTLLLPENYTGSCRECASIVSARLRLVVEERWRDLGDGEHIVRTRPHRAIVERGQIAPLPPRLHRRREAVRQPARGRGVARPSLRRCSGALCRRRSAQPERLEHPVGNAEGERRGRQEESSFGCQRGSPEGETTMSGRTSPTGERNLLGLRAGRARRGRLVDDGGQTSVRAGGHRPRAEHLVRGPDLPGVPPGGGDGRPMSGASAIEQTWNRRTAA